jgi:pimeloyl-ACP methyl ester carboxylesterase
MLALAVFFAAGVATPRSAITQVRSQVRVVSAGPATIRTVVRGAGDLIVLVPSRGRGSEDFDNLSERLVAAGYQVLLPEPRGIGGSTGPLDNITYHDLAADIAAVIRAIGAGPATIVGHAFGTRIARTLAADHPNLVRQLILLAVAGPIPRSRDIADATDRVFDPTVPQAERRDAVARAFFAKGNDSRPWHDGWHFEAAQAQRASDARTPLPEWWSGGSAPILVLQGAQDLVTPPENARRLVREFPDRVTLVEISGAGHAMLPEQPLRIADEILAYLRRKGEPPNKRLQQTGVPMAILYMPRRYAALLRNERLITSYTAPAAEARIR